MLTEGHQGNSNGSTAIGAQQLLAISPWRLSTWHGSVARSLSETYHRDPNLGWQMWRQHLAERSTPVGLSKVLPKRGAALLWGLPVGAEHESVSALIERLGSKRRKGGEDSVRVTPRQADWVESGLEYLAWCHFLPRLNAADSESWWAVFNELVTAVHDAAGLDLASDPLRHQRLAGELPLTLAYLFPEIEACRKLAARGQDALTRGLVELLDGEGLPHARNLPRLRPLLACWTRARLIGAAQQKLPWSEAAEEQYQLCLREAVRFTRRDRSQAFAPSGFDRRDVGLLKAARGFLADAADRALADATWLGKPLKKGRSRAKPLPGPAVHSEWSAAAMLRPDWSPRAPRFAATYDGRTVSTELAIGRDVLWSGVWDFEVRLDGELVRPTADWEEVCWVSDEDVDYLEVEAPLERGLRVQRQMLLAREDDFLLLADAVWQSEPGQLAYRSTLPLLDTTSFVPAVESREGLLEARKYRGLALPLALPEWRCDPRVGRLQATPQGLQLEQSTVGRALFAPLWIDLRPHRMLKPCTWRQLTVAENREILPKDVAVGYRVQVGGKQWLLYRSLLRPANRTVLGHNLSTDFLVARFDTQGLVRTLLEIE